MRVLDLRLDLNFYAKISFLLIHIIINRKAKLVEKSFTARHFCA